ncbi:hypothetical protein ACWFNS_19615 [Oerskovia enterophila]
MTATSFSRLLVPADDRGVRRRSVDASLGARAAHHELLGATTGVSGSRGDLTPS